MNKTIQYKGKEAMIELKSINSLRDGGSKEFDVIIHYGGTRTKEEAKIMMYKNETFLYMQGKAILDNDFAEHFLEQVEKYTENIKFEFESSLKVCEKLKENIEKIKLFVDQPKPQAYMSEDKNSIFLMNEDGKTYQAFGASHMVISEKELIENKYTSATYQQARVEMLRIRQEFAEAFFPIK